MKEGPEELLARQPPEIQELVARLREAVPNALPGAVEMQRRPMVFGYGRSRRMADLLFAIVPYRVHVNLEFADGARLPDPEHLLEGSGKNIRHVKIRTPEDMDKAEVRALVQEQLDARRG